MPDSPAAPAVSALSRPDTQPTLADLTTLRVGGDVDTYVETSTEAELIDVVRSADDAGEPLLVLGGGSNLLVADEGFSGVVVKDVRTGLRVESEDTCGGASMSGPAGHPWDDVVVQAIDAGWVGIEALSGIPGTLGAAPVQNVGAYGQEVAGVISTVRVWDRGENCVRTFANGELGFGYRTSRLKRSMHLGLAGYVGDSDDDPRAPGTRHPGTWCSTCRCSSGWGLCPRPWRTRSSRAGSVSTSVSGRRAPTCAPPSSSCAEARACSSTRRCRVAGSSGSPTTTVGAPARSSPTRSSPPRSRTTCRRERPGSRCGPRCPP
ncbi:hypothetical protein GCM10025864_05180 [Luteimicrobium album]|uniref:UDP-N-acetylenolpyruvoylglucosamine reductase n=1 Tax=Luteimicrobium album TaxID=1054550 RepID=A0ABQ6HZ29_9MICO|nr:hypothetical protein GCM10025864_05180 [Luteimicrobium album]